MTAGGLALLLAFQLAQVTAPSPTSSPPPTIIRLKTSPFCQVLRENVFQAVQGLRINDAVIEQGEVVLAKWARDSVVDQPHRGIGGASIQLDQVRLGYVVTQAARNLQKVHGLLNDPNAFKKDSRTQEDRDLATMNARLQDVATAQERSLNLLSGLYETAALNQLLSKGPTLPPGVSGSTDESIELGDPIFKLPGFIYPPNFSSQAGASLFAGTPAGRFVTAVAINQHITGDIETNVADAVMPDINRCR